MFQIARVRRDRGHTIILRPGSDAIEVIENSDHSDHSEAGDGARDLSDISDIEQDSDVDDVYEGEMTLNVSVAVDCYVLGCLYSKNGSKSKKCK